MHIQYMYILRPVLLYDNHIMEGETLMAKLKVQSGSATQVAGKVIDTLLNGINKWFQSFADYEKDLGWNKKGEEKIEKDGKQGVKVIYETGSGELIEVGILQQERNLDYCDLYAEATDNSLPVLEKHDLKISEVHKAIADWADSNNLGTIEDVVIDEDIESSLWSYRRYNINDCCKSKLSYCISYGRPQCYFTVRRVCKYYHRGATVF